MYSILTLLCGFVIAVMILINGQLSAAYDIFVATAIIHIVGVVFSFAVIKLMGRKIKFVKGLPFWVYLGGAFGILTTVFNNYSFGKISVTSIVAMGLFGQMVTSLLIDTFGLFHMPKYAFKKSSLIGLCFSLFGVFIMFDSSVTTGVVAAACSFAAGICIILTRVANGGLSKHIGALQGSFVNHLVGLPISIVIAAVFSGGVIASYSFVPQPLIYIGGALGVTVVLLSNLTVHKMPTLKMTVLMFCGQIFTSIALDLLVLNTYDTRSLVGGLLVSMGFLVNLRKKKV